MLDSTQSAKMQKIVPGVGPVPVFNYILNLIPEMKPHDPYPFPHVPVLQRYYDNIELFDFGASIRNIGIRATEARIKEFVKTNKVDLIIASLQGDSFQFSIEFFHELRGMTKLVLWQYDDECFFEILSKHYAQAVDAVVATGYFQVYAYRALRIPTILLHAQVNKALFYPVEAEKDIDVSFIGYCTKNDRIECIEFLRENGIKVETYGTGSKNGFLELSTLHKIYARTKINLNFTKLGVVDWLNDDDPMLNNVRQLKARPAQTAATRTFCLTEYEPSLPHAFEIGKEIICFHDKASLLEKVRYYLAHDREREEIAANAYKRALKDHEDDVYMPSVLLQLQTILERDPARGEFAPTPHTTYKSPRFKDRQINALFITSLSALRRGQIRIAAEIIPSLFQYGPKTFIFSAVKGIWRVICSYWLNITSPVVD